MPASRVGNDHVSIAEHDVLGFDSEGRAAFVAHVALSSKAFNGAPPFQIRITHMVPPFMAGAPSQSPDCFGSAELSDDNRRQVGEFIRELSNEYAAEEARRKLADAWNADAKQRFRADQYAIRPAVVSPTSDRPYHQLSCAGFVHEAYANADWTLLVEDEAEWPLVDKSTLKLAYPGAVDYLDDADFCAAKGLKEGDRWPVLLPGYVLHALARPKTAIESAPYRPAPGDEVFNPGAADSMLGNGGKK